MRMRLRGVLLLLAIGYPLMVHVAVVTGSPRLTALSLGWLAALALGPAQLRGQPLAWLAAAAVASVLALGAQGSWLWLPVYAPSIAADVFVAFLFARTLKPTEVPLIEQIVRLLHDPGERLDPGIPAYARRLTAAWAVLFGTLAGINLVLALLAAPHGILLLLGMTPPVTLPQRAWSLFANLLEYLVAALFFVGEFAYRRRRFPHQPYRNLLHFLLQVAAVTPRALGAGRGPAQLRGRQA